MINRRKFLTGSAAGATAASLGACTKAEDAGVPASGVNGYSYRLPRFKKGCRLLFQGDSITDMKWGRNQKDRNHYLGHSYVYLIAARLGADLPEAQLEFFTRGMSGHTVGDLRKRWQKDAIEMEPDLLSILIGTNDVNRSPEGVDLVKWEADYRYLLETSRKSNPALRLVLLDPFVLASGRFSNEEAFKKRREQTDPLLPVVGKLAQEYNAIHIKTQDIFDTAAKATSPEHWIWDGIHPLPQGHELIARHWIQEVSARDFPS